METGYEGGFTRRQELTCTETEMAAYADVVLYENEHIYVKMNSGMIRLKIGDGKTGLLNLPWAKVFDATLDDVEAIVGGFANRVETNTKRIENLEAAVSPEIVTPVTDSTVAYSKTVPKGALPNAAITEIGGMSYVKNGAILDSKVEAIESVGVNLVSLPYDELSKTINGVTFTINGDGSITAKGTATADANFPFIKKRATEPGDYYFNYNGVGASNNTFNVYCEKVNMTTGNFLNPYVANAGAITLAENNGLYISFKVVAGYTINTTIYPMLNRGKTALPYSPYFRNTFPIPEAVQNLDGYKQGLNKDYCNKIVLNPAEGVKKFVKATKRLVFDGSTDENWVAYRDDEWTSTYCKFEIYVGNLTYSSDFEIANFLKVGLGITTEGSYVPNSFMTHMNGNLYVALEIDGVNSVETWKTYLQNNPLVLQVLEATPTETDISAYFTGDNRLPVVPSGTITAVNEFEHEVPFTVKYMIKGA